MLGERLGVRVRRPAGRWYLDLPPRYARYQYASHQRSLVQPEEFMPWRFFFAAPTVLRLTSGSRAKSSISIWFNCLTRSANFTGSVSATSWSYSLSNAGFW